MTSNRENGNVERDRFSEERESRIIASALWAAGGDALGWITELSHGLAGVKRRTGKSTVDRPVPWKRLVGGVSGAHIDLPAGTYSDDTQLRLAVARSIRGNGEFDPETFAKVELTVWPAYALGAGRGSKAAAVNLTRRSVNWFSNFFDVKGSRYFNGGGNGACMRVQPHVWAAKRKASVDSILLDVLRDSIITHGHAHGFCGAVFHALALKDSLEGNLGSPADWVRYADVLRSIPSIVNGDDRLSTFWLAAWESESGISLAQASASTASEAFKDVEKITRMLGKNLAPADCYHSVLEVLGCLTPELRGSGLKTAIAASALAWMYRDSSVEAPLVLAANELESDTDSIGSMAGALLGAQSKQEFTWEIQDRSYIERSAKRLAAIGSGIASDTFRYPDLTRWNPPQTQTEVVGLWKEKIALAGLGSAEIASVEYFGRDAVWQWVQLEFGQTVLVKRKPKLKKQLELNQMPTLRAQREVQSDVPQQSTDHFGYRQPSLPLPQTDQSTTQKNVMPEAPASLKRVYDDNIDGWTEQIIGSKFDDATLGMLINRCIDNTGSIESAVAMISIVAKAKLARMRRNRQ